MTAKTAALLSDPHPNTHIVCPYGESHQMVTAVGHYVTEGIRRGESVVLIITEAHRSAVITYLADAGFKPAELGAEGRLLFLDAAALMENLFVENTPSPSAFEAIVGSAIRHPVAQAPSRKVRLYGDMVDQLCGSGRDEAAVRIEELWKTLDEAQYVPVLCSYSLQRLQPLRDEIRERLLNVHSHQLALT